MGNLTSDRKCKEQFPFYLMSMCYELSTYMSKSQKLLKFDVTQKILDLKGYNSSSLRSTWLNQKRKCSFFNREIKKASNVMVEEDLRKITKRAKIVDILSFLRYRKKVIIIVKHLRAFAFYNKSFNLSQVNRCATKKSPDSRYFNFLLHKYWKI